MVDVWCVAVSQDKVVVDQKSPRAMPMTNWVRISWGGANWMVTNQKWRYLYDHVNLLVTIHGGSGTNQNASIPDHFSLQAFWPRASDLRLHQENNDLETILSSHTLLVRSASCHNGNLGRFQRDCGGCDAMERG